jgi:flagellar protein FliJ
MKVNQSERLRRSKEFEVNQSRLRANQIETMIAEFHRMCVDLERQIEAEETRARIDDPTHFAYPTYAKAAREQRAKLQRSADALRIELDTLRSEANPNWQFSSASIVAA